MAMKKYIEKDGKQLRCGYTTGTCATGGAAAALRMLLVEEAIEEVKVTLPGGGIVMLPIAEMKREEGCVTCAIQKDGGDDPDVTHGMLIYTKVSLVEKDSPLVEIRKINTKVKIEELEPEEIKHLWIEIDGGVGIGRVTQKGLDQPVGHAAINSTPRRMIQEHVERIAQQYGYSGGIKVEIFAPEGEEVAKRTFNSQLGIVGGISILGTTGIVEPMSEKALVDSIKVEMNVVRAKGYTTLLAFPGNYASKFIQETLNIAGENEVKFSNYIGEILDYSKKLGFEELVIVSHIGKLVKVAVGMMNTHSHTGDARLEVLACYAAVHGVGQEKIQQILKCMTTDAALELLEEEGVSEQVCQSILERVLYYIRRKIGTEIKLHLIMYAKCGIVGQIQSEKE